MKASHKPELLVVGGGPAGLATAIAARRRGMEVEVLDRRHPPMDKACGEGLMPDGQEQLVALGVRLAPQESLPFRGIRYVDEGRVAVGLFPGRPGLGIRRLTLHEAMVKRAAEVGVRLRWGVKVVGLVPRPGGVWAVRTGDGVLEPQWLVAADGLHSPLRRWSRLEASAAMQAGTGRRFGVRRHYGISPWTDLVEVHWAVGCEAYVTPVGPKEVGVALLWSGKKSGFDELLGCFPTLCKKLEGAGVVSRDLGAGPLWQRVKGVCRGRLALVGDAGGYVDALTGEGLALAFHQALALAEAIGRKDLRHYSRRHRSLVRLPDLLTRLTLLLSRRPGLRRRTVLALAADGKLFSQILAIHSRAAHWTSLGRPATLRFLWRLTFGTRLDGAGGHDWAHPGLE